MGLIKAIAGAIRGEAADQWKEYFYCDAMNTDVLVVKGKKRIQGRFGSGNKGNDNLITNGSVVAVNEGQCMIIVDQGKVAEVCAEAGNFSTIPQQSPAFSSAIWGRISARPLPISADGLPSEEIREKTSGFISLTQRRSWGISTARQIRCLFGWWMPILDWTWIFLFGVTGSILTGS